MSDRRPENRPYWADSYERMTGNHWKAAGGKWPESLGPPPPPSNRKHFGVPENPTLYVLGPYRRDGHGFGYPEKREATPADLLAVVRRGVESGTIEGEVRTSYWSVDSYQIAPVKAGRYLVIPGSDRGKDRKPAEVRCNACAAVLSRGNCESEHYDWCPVLEEQ